MSAILIDVREKTYRNEGRTHQAIRNLQLEIRRNEFVCLLGPSGCGKTTLLNIVAGLDRDYRGSVGITGGNRRPNIGVVFQNPRLLPWYSLRRNIELVFADAPPAELIDSLLAAMQLQDAQQEYPEHLSLGQQRRAAIIRAFAVNPDILLMDEPFVSLDAPTARQIRTLLYALWTERPHTVLFASHDLREAIALADRLVFLAPPPMQVVTDITVTLQREERDDPAKVEAFREHLSGNFPAIGSFF